MTGSEIGGMAVGGAITLFVTAWGFFKNFASQKDLDDLQKQVDDLEKTQQTAAVLTAELKTTIRNLEGAVRELTRYLRGHAHQGPVRPLPLNYIPNMEEGS